MSDADTAPRGAAPQRRQTVNPAPVVNIDDIKGLSNERKFTLSRPITVDTAEGPRRTTELRLRLPTLEDMAEIAMPYQTYASTVAQSQRMEIVPNHLAVKQWVERLSVDQYSRGEIGALSAKDAMAVYNWLCDELNTGGGGQGN